MKRMKAICVRVLFVFPLRNMELMMDFLWKWCVIFKTSSESDVRISRIDALLVHVWILIIWARELSHDQQLTYLDVKLGVSSIRNFCRFIIIMLSKVLTIGAQPIVRIALSIRSILSKFDSSSIGVIVHDLASKVNPQKL
jgi:hypothetical protein